jgi:SAM-dependent MidA family methyltransferase
MTPAGELIAEEIRRTGPVTFHRFMELALYHPRHGYYRRQRDPFGKTGDFFTAEQIQPVFGILVATRIRELWHEMRQPPDFTVVELGAGRAEMAEAFAGWTYVPVEIDSGDLPARLTGVIFSNEFFDALPVHAAVWQGGAFRQRRVTLEGERFTWQTAEPCPEDVDDYLRRYFPLPEEGRLYEAGIDARGWVERISRSLQSGYVLSIDYGFTRSEAVRFPAGTLMGYRHHTALDDVLLDPGERDITAHVNFTALEEAGTTCGLRMESFRTLAQFLLDAGAHDQFASALAAPSPAEELRRRMQLKTLLFGMGETFRVLLQRKET